MANAYYEKIARINLTTGEVKVEKLDCIWWRIWIKRL